LPKPMLLKVCCLVLVLALAFPISFGFAGSGRHPGRVKVLVEADEVTFPDAQPVVAGNRVMVPLRAVAEALGWRVSWSPSAQIVHIIKNEIEVSVAIGGSVYQVDGQPREMNAVPFLQEQRTYVPVRFVSEGLGYGVSWDGASASVRIKPPVPVRVEPPAGLLPDRVRGHIPGMLLSSEVILGTLFLDGCPTIQVIQKHALRPADGDLRAALEAAVGQEVVVVGYYLPGERVFEVRGVKMEKWAEGYPGHIPGKLRAVDLIYGTLYLNGLYWILRFYLPDSR